MAPETFAHIEHETAELYDKAHGFAEKDLKPFAKVKEALAAAKILINGPVLCRRTLRPVRGQSEHCRRVSPMNSN